MAGFEDEYLNLSITWSFIITYLYYLLMEGGYGTTFGKMAFGILAVDKECKKIGFDRAIARNISRLFTVVLAFLIIPSERWF